MRDSIFITDSIQVPSPVVETKEVNKLKWYQEILIYLGLLCVGILCYQVCNFFLRKHFSTKHLLYVKKNVLFLCLFNGYASLGGIYGAAWGVGWELGRKLTELPSYVKFKDEHWYPVRYKVLGY